MLLYTPSPRLSAGVESPRCVCAQRKRVRTALNAAAATRTLGLEHSPDNQRCIMAAQDIFKILSGGIHFNTRLNPHAQVDPTQLITANC